LRCIVNWWKAAAYIDEQTSDQAYSGLITIFSGQAKGTTGLCEHLEAEHAPVRFETESNKHRLPVGRTKKPELPLYAEKLPSA
jgi:hypothetical protein